MDNITFMTYHEYNERKQTMEGNVVCPILDGRYEGYPYREFLSLINEKKPENYLSKVYYRHISKFEFLFGESNKFPENSFFMDEIAFDKTQFLNGIIELLNFTYGDGNNIFVIDINKLSLSSLRYVSYLIKNREKIGQNIFFVFIYDAEILINEEMFDEMIDMLFVNEKEKGCILNSIKELTFTEIDFLIKIHINVYSFDDAKFLINYIEKEMPSLTRQQELCLKKNKANYFFYTNNYDEALYLYNMLFDIDNMKDISQEDLFDINFKLSLINLEKENISLVEKLLNNCLSLEVTSKNMGYQLKCEYLLFTITFWRQHFDANTDMLRKKVENIEKLSYKTGEFDILARVYKYMASDNKIIGDKEKRMEYADKSIKISRKNGNLLTLSSGYHNKGVIYSTFGEYKKSFFYYNKSRKIKEKIGNAVEIVRIYNGLGYAYWLKKDTYNSLKFFDRAFGIISKSKNYSELAITIYNISTVYFVAGKYEQCIYYIEKLLHIMKMFNIKEIPFHFHHEILSLLGISYVKVNYIDKAKSINYILSKEEKPANFDKNMVYELFNTYIYIIEGKDITNKVLTLSKILKDSLLQNVLTDFVYKRLKELTDNKIDFTLNTPFEDKKIKVYNLKIDIDSVIRMITAENKINNLYRKINDFNFLTNINKYMLTSSENEKTLKQGICDIISMFYRLTFAFIVDKEDDLSVYSNSDVSKEVNKLLKQKNFFQSGLYNDFKTEEAIIKTLIINLINVRGVEKAFVIGVDEYLTFEDYRLFNIVSNQISVVLEKKIIQEEINQKNEELKKALEIIKANEKHLLENEKMATLGTIAAKLLHEIKNPISAVFTNTELLLLSVDDISNVVVKEEFREGLDIIKLGMKQVKNVLTNVSSFARNDSLSVVSLRNIVEISYNLLKKDLKENMIEFENNVDDNLTLRAYHDELIQIALNVMMNSKDAILEKRKVFEEKNKTGSIKVYSVQEDEFFLLKFEDTGIGMTDEIKNKLFKEKFTTKEIGKGTGVGTGVIKERVNKYGGEIEVISEYGKGTTFVFKFSRK